MNIVLLILNLLAFAPAAAGETPSSYIPSCQSQFENIPQEFQELYLRDGGNILSEKTGEFLADYAKDYAQFSSRNEYFMRLKENGVQGDYVAIYNLLTSMTLKIHLDALEKLVKTINSSSNMGVESMTIFAECLRAHLDNSVAALPDHSNLPFGKIEALSRIRSTH